MQLLHALIYIIVLQFENGGILEKPRLIYFLKEKQFEIFVFILAVEFYPFYGILSPPVFQTIILSVVFSMF